MASPVMTLCNLIEDIKTNITDAQYKEMLEQLQKVHNEYTWELPPNFRLSTPDKVIGLVYSIIRSGVKNPGKLAHILKKKGHSYDQYLHESFKEWMADIGVIIHNNNLVI